MNLFEVLVLISTATIVIYFAWNFLNTKSHPNRRKNNDIRYYELKSKYEFLVAVVTLFIAVGGYLGYTTISGMQANLKQDIQAQLKPSQDSVKVTEMKVKRLQQRIELQSANYDVAIKTSIAHLEKITQQQKTVDAQSLKSGERVTSLQKRVKEISEMNVLRKEFYILKDTTLKFDMSGREPKYEGSRLLKFKFSQMRTMQGEHLPVFEKPPFLLSSGIDGGTLSFFNITKHGFEAMLSSATLSPERKEPDTGTYFYRFQIIVYY